MHVISNVVRSITVPVSRTSTQLLHTADGARTGRPDHKEPIMTASRVAFVGLPVKDLARSTEFFTALGFAFDEQQGDDTSARMIISDQASVMLFAEPFFSQFTGGGIADPHTAREVTIGVSATSRDEVDELAETAVAAGAKSAGVQDEGFMYMRAFHDLDGHYWSVIHMAY
jgi:predicted lactoylglutathione lyase